MFTMFQRRNSHEKWKKTPEENQNRAKKYSYNKIAIMTEFSQTLIKTFHIVLWIVD